MYGGRLVGRAWRTSGALVVDPEEDIMVITESGLSRPMPRMGKLTARNTMGVILPVLMRMTESLQ